MKPIQWHLKTHWRVPQSLEKVIPIPKRTLQEFQDLCSDKIVIVATDNTTVVSYTNKKGGMRSVHLVPYCGES